MAKHAKTPPADDLQKVFLALVENGLDFLERAAGEIDREQKFSIAHFATGLELLLKARLFHEHWTLISVEPHKCAWSNVKEGTVRTVQAADLCAAITTTTGTPLSHEGRAFKAIFDHRNRVLHWAPQSDLAATVAEQCRAWHHLRQLLTTTWIDAFSKSRLKIDRVEQELRQHRTYLNVRFEQAKHKLMKAENSGLAIVCPSCEFKAAIAEDSTGRVHRFQCEVCEYSAAALRAATGELEARDVGEILDELGPTPNLKPKEMSTYVPDRGHCGECSSSDEIVALDGKDYVCLECFARFDSPSTECEWCNARWFGWDSEGSYYSGCEHCEGHQPRDD